MGTRLIASVYLLPVLLLFGGAAHAQKWSGSAKLSKGKVTVTLKATVTSGMPRRLARQPRVGVAPTASSYGAPVAQQLEATGKVAAVSPSRISGTAFLRASFELMPQGDLTDAVGAACRRSRLDYLLLLGTPQLSAKTDITAMIFFVGKSRMRNRFEVSLYDCQRLQPVWAQQATFETSRGVINNAFDGGGANLIMNPEADKAMARLLVEKLTADLGW
jgi:hypothetical protein